MAKQITQFAAEDGSLFDTEEAADAHDAHLASSKHVEAYITAAGLEKAQAGLMRKHGPQFLAFVDHGTLPKKEEKKAPNPEAKKRGPKPKAAEGAPAPI